MSLVTLGRTDFLKFCPRLYYNAVSGLTGLPRPALSVRLPTIIQTAFLQKIFPAVNGFALNLFDDQSFFL